MLCNTTLIIGIKHLHLFDCALLPPLVIFLTADLLIWGDCVLEADKCQNVQKKEFVIVSVQSYNKNECLQTSTRCTDKK